jgi:hypothetical protein
MGLIGEFGLSRFQTVSPIGPALPIFAPVLSPSILQNQFDRRHSSSAICAYVPSSTSNGTTDTDDAETPAAETPGIFPNREVNASLRVYVSSREMAPR